MKAFRCLLNPRTWGPFVEIAEKTNFDHAFSVSWAQGGEDLALQNVFFNMTLGSYIDIGAHHPSRFSVTRALYDKGWSGVNIDANGELIPAFNRSRPRDINICAAVGSKESYALNIFAEPAISTVEISWAENFIAEGNKVERTEFIPGRKLRNILDLYFMDKQLTLLTIDVEGADLDALESIDFKTLPTSQYPLWILLETIPPVKDALNFGSVRHALDFGYQAHLVLPMATLLRYPVSKTSK